MDINCSPFSSFLRLRSLFLKLSSFKMQAPEAMNIPYALLKLYLTHFWSVVFLFIQFKICSNFPCDFSLTHRLCGVLFLLSIYVSIIGLFI